MVKVLFSIYYVPDIELHIFHPQPYLLSQTQSRHNFYPHLKVKDMGWDWGLAQVDKGGESQMQVSVTPGGTHMSECVHSQSPWDAEYLTTKAFPAADLSEIPFQKDAELG